MEIPTPECWVPDASSLHQTGLFATREIQAGEEILARVPLLASKLTADPDTERWWDNVIVRLCIMSDSGMERLWKIARRCGGSGLYRTSLSEFDRMVRFMTNTNRSRIKDVLNEAGVEYDMALTGRSWFILDDTIGLLNHSCAPNAELSFVHLNPSEDDAQLTKLTLRSQKMILPNEEITVAYTDVFKRMAKRREDLGFFCLCPECCLGPVERYFSETWRHDMSFYFAMVVEFRTKHHLKNGVSALDDGVPRDGLAALETDKILMMVDQVLACLQAADMESAMLMSLTDVGAVICVAKAERLANDQDQEQEQEKEKWYLRAMVYKLKELDILTRCLGKHHYRTKQTLEQLPDLAVGEALHEMYIEVKGTMEGDAGA